MLLAGDKNNWRKEEHEGWQCVGEPETDILLSIDYADTTDQRSGVDYYIEVQEDPGVSDLGTPFAVHEAATLYACCKRAFYSLTL